MRNISMLLSFSALFVACEEKKSAEATNPTTADLPVETAKTKKTGTDAIFVGKWTNLEDVTGDVAATKTKESNPTDKYMGSPSVFALASNIKISPLAFDATKTGKYEEKITLTINEDLTGELYNAVYLSYDKDFEGKISNVFENINQQGKVVASKGADGSYALNIEVRATHLTMCKDQNIDTRVEKDYTISVVCNLDGNNANCTHADKKTTLKR